jgi:hypothetical protein
MRFMCLVNMDPSITAGMTEDDWREFQRGTNEFDQELMAAGKFVSASPLDQPETAVTIRLRKGSMMMTDGPFVETKEYIAGFFIFEAEDKNEAAEIASRSPFVRVGSVEVRALREY